MNILIKKIRFPELSPALGLLLWPFMATDHILNSQPRDIGIKGIFKKIRNTIEDLF